MQGYFDDDGTPIDLSQIEIPNLCKNCVKNSIPEEEINCSLNRFDQQDDVESGKDFICGAYKTK